MIIKVLQSQTKDRISAVVGYTIQNNDGGGIGSRIIAVTHPHIKNPSN